MRSSWSVTAASNGEGSESAPPRRYARILLVEDSPTDAMMVRDILSQVHGHNALHVVEDGMQALQFLRREGPYADAPRPDLILLDLQLPRKTGQEVLREIKTDEKLRTIPVVVLSSSREERDIARLSLVRQLLRDQAARLSRFRRSRAPDRPLLVGARRARRG